MSGLEGSWHGQWDVGRGAYPRCGRVGKKKFLASGEKSVCSAARFLSDNSETINESLVAAREG